MIPSLQEFIKNPNDVDRLLKNIEEPEELDLRWLT